MALYIFKSQIAKVLISQKFPKRKGGRPSSSYLTSRIVRKTPVPKPIDDIQFKTFC